MKRLLFILIVLLSSLSCLYSQTLNFSIKNRDVNIITTDDGSRVIQTDSYYSGNKADPSIPILTYNFEIPEFTKIESVNIQADNIKYQILDKALLQQPEQVIMSKTENVNTQAQVYKAGNFPQAWLFNSGSSMAGSMNIGYLAIYACSYNLEENKIAIPQDFTVTVTLQSAPEAKAMRDSRITREIQQRLGLSPNREIEQETYLLIYPFEYAESYIPMINQRRRQGLNVITAVVEVIENEYEGIDLADKIRNYIKIKYEEDGVDYVTLGGDVEHIPARRLWAFDCNYGIEDENNIPGDIYYANLNGDWNANQNNLYGEDDDNVDQFPEVVVSRIPARLSSTEVTAMIYKTIMYETTVYQDYSQGLGLSSNLWEESNSVYTQEYIEDMYYPDYINNVILNEDDNNVANAQLNFNRNPNIIQHTGHCFWSVIALGNGTINSSFVNNMQNDYAGVMYSIGCWAVAMEFNAIAEELVRVPEHGVTSFVGNSRYGWGAPSADGFGFSEFYQKEYFKLLFTEGVTNVAMANQLQKLPFIAYQKGDSVYKWCSYQLNTLGDSHYTIFNAEPKELDVQYSHTDSAYNFFVTDEDGPVEDALLVYSNFDYALTDNSGHISIQCPYDLYFVSFYKEGYKLKELVLEDVNASRIVDYQLPEIVAPSTDKIISFKLRNGLDIDLAWELRVKEGDEILGSTSGILVTELSPDWLEVSFTQPETDLLSLELYSNTTNEVVDTKQIRVDLGKPIIEISEFALDHYPLAVNEINRFHYKIKNSSAYTLNDFDIEYSSDYLEFPSLPKQRTSLEPGQECTVYSDIFQLTSDVDYLPLNIIFTLSNDYWEEETLEFPYSFSVGDESFYENFEEEATWFEEAAWQRSDYYAYAGNYSLTCSPQDYGQYDLDLPLLTYTDNLTLSFMYKYKMPMYGEDGFSVFVVTDDSQERLIFLGSGGALDNQDKDPEDLISGDWAEISLNLSDLLLNEPEIGSEFILRFSFTYIHDLNVNNDYANNDDLGVFLDNMQICYDGQAVSNEEDVEAVNNHISLYPNPLRNSPLSLKHNSKIGEEYEVSIYNLKGQKVDSFKSTIKSMDKDAIQLPIFQKNRSKMASGIYFVKYKSVDTSVTKKILFIK